MSTTIVELLKFDGGHAEDIRTFANDECEKSLNFDILTNPHKLIPFGDSVAESLTAGDMNDMQISDVEVSLIGTTYLITGTGYESSGSVKPTFYCKADIVSAFQQYAIAAGNAYQRNSLVIYKDKAYALGFNGSNTYSLYKFNSAGSVTTIGTISSSSTFYCKPFVHPEDNVLYILIGTTITSWDASTLTTTTTILPAGFEAVSQCEYGTYLAITMRPLRSNGNAITYLWGRDATINTLQGEVPWGEGYLVIVENLHNYLIAIMQPQFNLGTSLTNKIIVKGYAGGAVETLKSITVGTFDYLANYKAKNNDKLYFGSINSDDCVYVVAKNKGGSWIISKDRYLFNGVMSYSGLRGLSMIGDIMWRAMQGTISAYKLMRSKTTNEMAYTATSIYKTTINPNMPIADRYKQKKLLAVELIYTGKASGNATLKYSFDGATMTTIIDEDTTAIEDIKEATNQANEESFLDGRELQFQIESTGGVEIKGLRYKYSTLQTTI